MKRFAIMTVTGEAGAPSLAQAAAQVGVQTEDLNAAFGVVPVDPAQSLYAVEVDEERLAGPVGSGADYRGPFSNPRIAPFGPLQDADDD